MVSSCQYAPPLNNYWTIWQIFRKLGMIIMPLEVPHLYLQFPIINSTKMTAVRNPERGVTLALLNVK
jgi:hypothetical protein